MPFRFFRRLPLGDGLTMNLSKTGVSFSGGGRGGGATFGTSGARGTLSLPGTGLFYTLSPGSLFSSGKRKTKKPRTQPSEPEVDNPLELGFFEKFFIPEQERRLVDGLKAMVAGSHDTALMYFEQAQEYADACWIAGMYRLKQRAHDQAEAHLNAALADEANLGTMASKYTVEVVLQLPITEHVSAHTRPCRRGTLLALVESCQDRGALEKAGDYLDQLLKDDPTDIVVQLSMAEHLFDTEPLLPEPTAKRIVALIDDVDNESDLHAALLLYKGIALNRLGLSQAARDLLTQAYRRKKDRDPELLKAVRYHRALVYETLGQRARARGEFEGLYATDPDYEDVARRLGM